MLGFVKMNKRFLYLSLVLIIMFTGTSAQESDPLDVMPDEGLKDVAVLYDLLIGTSTEAFHMTADPNYVRVLSREYNLITPENAMKWLFLRPDEDTFDFEQADLQIEIAESYEMEIRGHALIWHKDLPLWLTNGEYTFIQIEALSQTHIETVVSHYQGRIFAWDVINEPFAEDGTLLSNIFLDAMGPNYISKALEWAHEADPDALLFINESNADVGNPKSDALYALAQELLENDVPLHGIGLQMHTSALEDRRLDPAAVDENITRFGELGLIVHITEMDVDHVYTDDWDGYFVQAEIFGDIFTVCMINEYCTAFSTWGLNDRFSWLRQQDRPDSDRLAPLFLDENYNRKPAYWAVFDAMFLGLSD